MPKPKPEWTERTLGKLPLSETTTLKLRVLTAEDGTQFADLRLFVKNPRYQGPTKRGFRLALDHAPALIELVAKLTHQEAGDAAPRRK